jgi:hypothetical protein
MNENMKSQSLTKSEASKMLFRRLKPTCANSRVPASSPLGHVGNYAPSLACRLRLALHHISIFRTSWGYSAIRNGIANTSSSFLWIRNLAKADLYLALLVGLLTYLMMSLVPEMPEGTKVIMIWFQVFLSIVIVSQIASGVGLYWATGSLVGIVDKLLLRFSLRIWPVTTEIVPEFSSTSSK